jgi:hypothetical protein
MHKSENPLPEKVRKAIASDLAALGSSVAPSEKTDSPAEVSRSRDLASLRDDPRREEPLKRLPE